MPTVWRAGDFAPAEREESFLHALAKSCAPHEYPPDTVRVLDDDNHTRAANVGLLRVQRVCLTEVQARRSPRLVRRADSRLCAIFVPSSGKLLVEQSGRRTDLGTGAFTLTDLSRPCRVDIERANFTAVMFPRTVLSLRDDDITAVAATPFDRTHPGGALVTAVVREVTGNLDAYEGSGGGRIGTSVLDLISATLAARLDRAHAVPFDAQRGALVASIRVFIEENLTDPDLAPPVIAARHYISVRQLHKLFEYEDTTVADLIRTRRLARCHNDILDPAQATTPVNVIGARWGFRRPTHFSRIFRGAYGAPPDEYRRAAALT